MEDETMPERLGFVWKHYRTEVLTIGAIMSVVLVLIVAYVT